MSSVYGHGDGWSITTDNLKASVITFAVRRCIKATWINDRDQFTVPDPAKQLPADFYSDCLAFMLFNGSNQTSAFNTEYKGVKYRIVNEWFPFRKEFTGIASIQKYYAPRNDHERYISEEVEKATGWLKKLTDLARPIYKIFFENLHNLDRPKFRIEEWDSGWYQVRKALEDKRLAVEELKALKLAHNELKLELRAKVYEYGFLPEETSYLTEEETED